VNCYPQSKSRVVERPGSCIVTSATSRSKGQRPFSIHNSQGLPKPRSIPKPFAVDIAFQSASDGQVTAACKKANPKVYISVVTWCFDSDITHSI